MVGKKGDYVSSSVGSHHRQCKVIGPALALELLEYGKINRARRINQTAANFAMVAAHGANRTLDKCRVGEQIVTGGHTRRTRLLTIPDIRDCRDQRMKRVSTAQNACQIGMPAATIRLHISPPKSRMWVL